MSMKNSSDTIGNRTRDLPVCSTGPQPTAPPRTPLGAYGTDFTERYLSIFRKTVKKIHVSLKSDKNNGYFT